jgi:hypothetical protein
MVLDQLLAETPMLRYHQFALEVVQTISALHLKHILLGLKPRVLPVVLDQGLLL